MESKKIVRKTYKYAMLILVTTLMNIELCNTLYATGFRSGQSAQTDNSLWQTIKKFTTIASDTSAQDFKLSDDIIPMLALSRTLRIGSDRWKKNIQRNNATEHTQFEKERSNTYKWYKPISYRSIESVAQFNLQNKDGIVTIHTDIDQNIIQEPHAKDIDIMDLSTGINDKPTAVTDFNDHTKCTYTMIPIYNVKADKKLMYVGTWIRGSCDTTMQSELLQAALAKALDAHQ